MPSYTYSSLYGTQKKVTRETTLHKTDVKAEAPDVEKRFYKTITPTRGLSKYYVYKA